MANGAVELHSREQVTKPCAVVCLGICLGCARTGCHGLAVIGNVCPVCIERIRVFHVEHGNTYWEPLSSERV